ncbi:MAG: CHAD domain-containing protein [Rhodopseudomonas sp.]|uniref:CHAD domain-containing protein n=1 Tax=Rhodopseudomonas sp. TaxID=1078 RepID=UPI0017C03EC3|nr:CHAD domain-containing protein [Rhodopseudomonas sp.]NVN85061.1 CHAD domain-containing protein [Rhodopseudomonas sp.]
MGKAVQRQLKARPQHLHKVKALRGRGRATGPKPASQLVLDPEIGTVDAVKAICGWLRQIIAAQQQAVRQRKPLGVHQMRIGLRRMRAAISVFAPLLHDAQTARVARELKWLAGRLAPARDLYVMQMRVDQLGIASGSPAFRKRLAASRIAAFDKAKAAVEQPRFRALLLEIGRWIDSGDWTSQPPLPANRRTARRFAKHVLTTRADRVIDKAKHLNKMSVERRHRLRIAAKKLYYATGFFESLFVEHKAAKRLSAFRTALKNLLDALGALNDIAVQSELARKLARAPDAAARQAAPATRSLSDLNKAESAKLLKAAAKAGRKLADRPLFGD